MNLIRSIKNVNWWRHLKFLPRLTDLWRKVPRHHNTLGSIHHCSGPSANTEMHLKWFSLCEFSNLFLLPRGVSICLVPVLMRRGRAWSVVTHVVTPDPGTPGQSVMVTSITRCLRCYQDAADFHEVGFLTIQNKKVDTSSERLSIVYIQWPECECL